MYVCMYLFIYLFIYLFMYLFIYLYTKHHLYTWFMLETCFYMQNGTLKLTIKLDTTTKKNDKLYITLDVYRMVLWFYHDPIKKTVFLAEKVALQTKKGVTSSKVYSFVFWCLIAFKKFKISKIFPTYPWNIPQTPNQEFMKGFLSFGGLGIHGVCSRGMLGFS